MVRVIISYISVKLTSHLRFDAARMWLVVILTGFGIGLTGGWLDVLVKW
jgi:hypothetical protein